MAMLRAMDSAVAGLRAHQNKMDVIGNNIANVNTWGFKSQSYNFQEALYQTAAGSTAGGADADNTAGGINAAQYGYGSLMGSISTDMTGSSASYTGGLNAFISGDGFFITMPTASQDAIDASDSDELKGTDFQYTRVGQFQLDNNGFLTDLNGNFVYGFQPDDPQGTVDPTNTELVPLRAPQDLTTNGSADPADDVLQVSSVTINSYGEITGTVDDPNGGDPKTISLGKVAIANFQNPNGLTKTGGNYYSANMSDNTGQMSATLPGGSTATLMAGYLETSNVDLAKEFSEMITTQRGFQANSKIITVSDEMLNELVNMKR